MTKNSEFPYEEIIELLKVGYREFGYLSLNTIDALVDYLIEVNIREDKEFKSVLGEGYYK